jgi:prevent-host-death family protein
MNRLAATKMREHFSDALNRVAFGKERIVIERSGKDIAVLISVEDLAFLEEFEKNQRKSKLQKISEKLHGTYSKTFQRLADE